MDEAVEIYPQYQSLAFKTQLAVESFSFPTVFHGVSNILNRRAAKATENVPETITVFSMGIFLKCGTGQGLDACG
jgi:hypothetical protein